MSFRNKAITKEIQERLTPPEVLLDLLEGNERFIKNETHFIDHKALIPQTLEGQYPKAIVLSCIDSIVPIELIFVARVAGNFENTDILGNMEYSCKVAGNKLVFVLGHENCGAIKATCDCVKIGNITSMLENIKPAIELSKKQIIGVKNSSNKEFVGKTIDRIRKKSPTLKEMEENDEIKIVGGAYHFATGKVMLL